MECALERILTISSRSVNAMLTPGGSICYRFASENQWRRLTVEEDTWDNIRLRLEKKFRINEDRPNRKNREMSFIQGFHCSDGISWNNLNPIQDNERIRHGTCLLLKRLPLPYAAKPRVPFKFRCRSNPTNVSMWNALSEQQKINAISDRSNKIIYD